MEVCCEEDKTEGLDQYQQRDFQAIQRHVALVIVVCSMLRATRYDPVLRDQRQRQLEGSLPAWQRATQAQAL